LFKRVEGKPGQRALTRPRRQAEGHGLPAIWRGIGRVWLSDEVEVHIADLEAVSYAEKLSFVGNRQNNSVTAHDGGTSLARCMDSHRERDACWQVVSKDDVVILGFC
jgi:hypothetical protein